MSCVWAKFLLFLNGSCLLYFSVAPPPLWLHHSIHLVLVTPRSSSFIPICVARRWAIVYSRFQGKGEPAEPRTLQNSDDWQSHHELLRNTLLSVNCIKWWCAVGIFFWGGGRFPPSSSSFPMRYLDHLASLATLPCLKPVLPAEWSLGSVTEYPVHFLFFVFPATGQVFISICLYP